MPNDDLDLIFEIMPNDALTEEECDLPKYSDEGWIVVEIVETEAQASLYSRASAKYTIDEFAYGGCAYWINEGMGIDYWLDESYGHLFLAPGWYKIGKIKGQYIRGDWSWGEDDDEIWESRDPIRITEKSGREHL